MPAVPRPILSRVACSQNIIKRAPAKMHAFSTGKQAIKVEHLLTHTAGFPYGDGSMWDQLHETEAVLQVNQAFAYS